MELANTMKLPHAKPVSKETLTQGTPHRGRFRQWKSLTAIFLVFLMPIAALCWYVVDGQQKQIAAAQTQLKSHGFGAALARFLTAVSAHQSVSAQLVSGDPAAVEPLGRAAAEVSAAVAAVDILNADYGVRIGVAERWAQLRARWTRLQAEQKSLFPAQNFDAHSTLIKTGNSLLTVLTGRNAASADMLAADLKIGAVQAAGWGLTRSRQISAEQRDLLTRAIAEANVAVDSAAPAAAPDAKSAGSTAVQANARVIDAARQLLAAADSAFIAGLPPQFDPGAWLSTTTPIIKALNTAVTDLFAREGETLKQTLTASERKLYATWVAIAVFGVIALLGMIFFGRRLLHSTHEGQAQSVRALEENRRNQASILRLMQELSAIEKGDLTAQATVTEEITGAIADTVNLTVSQLRKVVSDINHASGQVSSATLQARETARKLIAAATRQAQDIEAADVSVELMTQSMGEVSASATNCAQVAQRTFATTERGSRAVQESIGGMNDIRQQIQETSKRIKRLGESSQEIGQIVDVITDLAEQTDVLALNAAIQAAAAGEAGRAFAVVAEEVQSLAERSADATTQIASLVKTIQTDTQEAVTAMERSIQGVVNGARLSDAAGQSLKDIETATRDLSEMIQGIAVSTETQVVVAEEVRGIMRDVLSVTGATTEGTQRTSTSVVQVAELASALKASVSQFKVA